MAPYTSKLDLSLRVAIVQTSLDPECAWKNSAKMEPEEEERAISEIRAFFSALHQEPVPPDIVLLPELSVPTGFENHLRKMATHMRSVVIAGVDYRAGSAPGTVHNDALIIVPKRWRDKKMSVNTTVRRIGKTYPAPVEEKKLNSISCHFQRDPTVWLFDGGEIGRFGVLVCYDFLDLERIAMYRKRVHHLFILALNRDTTSFNHVAEAVARMAFCNVIVCNCGYFGGSLAVAPYRLPERRTIYQHAGPKLAAMQVIELPVHNLDMHQNLNPPIFNGEDEFKNLPPGYNGNAALVPKPEKM